MGAQSELGDAHDFFRDFGPFTFPMYWDPTGDSWSAAGVAYQPAVAVFDANGRLIEQWYGNIQKAERFLESA